MVSESAERSKFGKIDDGRLQQGSLAGNQLSDTRFPERKHLVEFVSGKCCFFSRPLDFDKSTVARHQQVHTAGRILIFLIIQIEKKPLINHAHTHGSDQATKRPTRKLTARSQRGTGQADRDRSAGDRCGSGPAVGLENITVDPQCPLSKSVEIHGSPKGSSDQSLNLYTSAV